MSNIIDSNLQVTEVLDSALVSFKRTLIALGLFSMSIQRNKLKGTDEIAVPFYGLEGNRSRRRSAGESYKSKVSGTTTESRVVKPNRNMIQGLSFTSEEKSRQPALNTEMHGMLKGQRLAYDVMGDCLLEIAAGVHTGATIDAVSAANFDESDVAALAKICEDEYWPEEGRGLILRPGHHFNLAQQNALLDQSQSGSGAVLRAAELPDLFGFREIGTAGLRTNNLPGLDFQGAAATDTLTITLSGDYTDEALSDYLVNGARVQVTEGTTLPTGLTDGDFYFVRDLDLTNGTCKLAAEAGGAAIDLTGDGSADNLIARRENIAGIATHQSGIITAFAPVEPTAGIRSKLVDYQIVEDDESDLVLEYKHIAYDDSDEEAQFIECHYGCAPGDEAAIKIIRDATLEAA